MTMQDGGSDQGAGGNSLEILSQIGVASVVALIFIMTLTFLLRYFWQRCAAQEIVVPAGEQERDGGRRSQAGAQLGLGLDEAAVAALGEVFVLEGGSAEAGEGRGRECAVCLAEYKEGDTCRRLDKCSHAFHQPCIDTWLRSNGSCPLCRVVLKPDSEPDAADPLIGVRVEAPPPPEVPPPHAAEAPGLGGRS